MTEDRAQKTENRRQTISELLCSRAEELVKSGGDGLSIAHQLTDIVDNLLISTYDSVITKSSTADRRLPTASLALIAIGGYGRREVAPFSDIDIMLLAKNRDNVIMKIAQSVLYHFWDMGLNISHCFRTLSECVEDAMKDIQTRTSLIEARFLSGSQDLFDEFKQDVYQKLLFKGKKEFAGDMLREIDRRHKEYGDSVYLLEPNVKEGRGGLRDIHSISWLLKTGLRINDIEGLRKILSENDYNHFVKAYDFLLKTRVCLHFITKRRNDVLSFELQKETARSLGFNDTKRFFCSEILMRLYYRKAKSIMDVLTKIMNICSRQYIKLYIDFHVPIRTKKITDDFYLSKNEIIIKDRDLFKNTDKILEAFHIYSITGKKFSYQVRENIRSRFLFINKKTRSSRKAIMYFIEILRGSRVYETLREMHDTGILDRFIPEFGRLRHLVIQEPYHRYTVDEHTLNAIRNLELLKNTRHKKLGYLSDILKGVKQEILFLSILLHDIGKGAYPSVSPLGKGGIGGYGRHEDYGYRILKGIMERFNIGQGERQRIEFLVRNHIVLSKLALTRDSDAAETITQLAEAVGSEENLNALYLMTYADMTAVNPNFWTEWKAYLFYDIYTKTRDHLRGIGRQYFEIADIKIKEFVKDMPDRYLISTPDDEITEDYRLTTKGDGLRPIVSISERTATMEDKTAELTIVADNMPGLFSRIVGVLGFRGLNILRARLYTGKSGLVIDKILVVNWKDMWWQGMEEQVKDDFKKAILNQDQEKASSKKSAYRLLPTAYCESAPCPLPLAKRFESFIEIDNETSREYTILELLSPDRLGLLYDISTQFYAHNVDIISAVINTEDRVAQDVFYLQYDGGKLNAEITMKVLNSVTFILCPSARAVIL